MNLMTISSTVKITVMFSVVVIAAESFTLRPAVNQPSVTMMQADVCVQTQTCVRRNRWVGVIVGVNVAVMDLFPNWETEKLSAP